MPEPYPLSTSRPQSWHRNRAGLCWFGEHLGNGRSSWYLTAEPDPSDTHWLPAGDLPEVPNESA